MRQKTGKRTNKRKEEKRTSTDRKLFKDPWSVDELINVCFSGTKLPEDNSIHILTGKTDTES